MITDMAGRRAHVILPEELVSEIDSPVGKRGRSRFIVSAAQAELRRQKQLAALRKAAGSWKDEDHPELKKGAVAWVRKLRHESDQRLTRLRQR